MRVNRNTLEDWSWLVESLNDHERKWFVATVFERQPVPRRMFHRFLHVGVLERNPSLNQRFIKPCVRSFGARHVIERLLEYLSSGCDAEKAGAASALYWVQPRRDENIDDLVDQCRRRCLQEFVENPDVDVRRRIVPRLRLDADLYPEELRPLLSEAIAIARSHPDEYIRHRIEIQLGGLGPYLPIPDEEL
jgi:hypothetical protein